MKKIVYGLLATISGLVLLFSYRTSWEQTATAADAAATLSGGTTTTDTGTTSTDSSATDDETSESSADDESGEATDSGSSSSSSSTTTTSTGLADGSYTGAAASTRYGNVQVQITVSGGQITAIDVPQYPSNDRHDIQINQYSLPILIDETISAQSSDISMVSGATFTSMGYIQSLQSAIDQATA